MPYPKGDRNYTKDFVIVVRLKHARDCIERSMNWTSVRSDNEKTEYIPPPRYLERREAQCQEGLPSDWDSGVIVSTAEPKATQRQPQADADGTVRSLDGCEQDCV